MVNGMLRVSISSSQMHQQQCKTCKASLWNSLWVVTKLKPQKLWVPLQQRAQSLYSKQAILSSMKYYTFSKQEMWIRTSMIFNPNRSLDRYSTNRDWNGNFLSSFIFLLASCFSFVLAVARYAFELTNLLNNLMKSVQELMTDLGLTRVEMDSSQNTHKQI